MEIHQFVPALLYGDAIGNQTQLLRRMLQESGYNSEIYAEFIDPKCAGQAQDYRRYTGHPENVVIYHHAIGSKVADYVRTLPDKLVLYYHNITRPESFLGFNRPMRQMLAWGRRQLRDHANASYALAGSEYNREEMLSIGYTEVDLLTYGVEMSNVADTTDNLQAQQIMRSLRDGKVNWLFVGRIAPNKRQDNVLRAFHYYHTHINANSRLIFVGSDTTAPAYGMAVRLLVARLDIVQAVQFAGYIGNNESMMAYYQCADVFVCFSEHEGFCVPLLESMHFDVPIVALDRAAISYTLGNSGVVLSDYRFDVLAEIVECLQHNKDFQQKIISEQRRQLSVFALDRVRAQLQKSIQRMLSI